MRGAAAALALALGALAGGAAGPAPEGIPAAVLRYADGDGAAREAALAELRAADAIPEADVARWREWASSAVRRRPKADGQAVRDPRFPMRYRLVGTPQAGGPLLVYLHGGGRGSEVNDYAWGAAGRTSRFMGFPCTLLPRTLDDDNIVGWTQDRSVLGLEALLRETVRTHGFDTNRIYVGGSSMGGYGTSLVGPLLADRCAAIYAEAGGADLGGAPSVRNTPFAIQIGALDAGRVEAVRELRDHLAALRRADPAGYEVRYKEVAGAGHNTGMDSEREIGEWLKTKKRDPLPKTVVWEPTRPGFRMFSWLGLSREGFDAPARRPPPRRRPPRGRDAEGDDDAGDGWDEGDDGAPIRAEIQAGNRIAVTGSRPGLAIFLNASMADLSREVVVTADGREAFRGRVPPSRSAIVESICDREDPAVVFTHRIELR